MALLALVLSLPVVGEEASSTPPDLIVELDELVVTASRSPRPAAALPGNVSVLNANELRSSPAQTVDTVLRQIPGFSLFRRTGSLTAHPTTQGVSLRGIGASGASRSLVLLDGVPLNDPFGGWVQWGKVPVASVDRVEVIRGGAHAWGNYALSGVINLVTRSVGSEGAWSVRGGNQKTFGLDVANTVTRGKLEASLYGGVLRTGGYHTLDETDRGLIDRPTNSKTATARTLLRYRPSESTTWTLQTGLFADSRENGTVLTGNRGKSAHGSLGLAMQTAGSGRLSGVLFGQLQRFSSRFSAQSSDRDSENPALDQYNVPSYAVGTSMTYDQPTSSRTLVSFGVDGRRMVGSTHESFFFRDGSFVREREAGGNQTLIGGYAQTMWMVSRSMELTFGLRADRVENADGRRIETDTTTNQNTRDDRHAKVEQTFLSPRAGVVFRPNSTLTIRGAAYRSFRAPTLNELYRPFRVGSIITAANERLDGERLTGLDGGIAHTTTSTSLKAGLYWNRVDGSIANLTLASGPGNIPPCGFVPGGGLCRQRTNLGYVDVWGLEAAAERRFGHGEGAISYLYTNTSIQETADQALLGNRLPQVPEHTLSARIGATLAPGLHGTLFLRLVGNQFEDNANTQSLDGYGTIGLTIRKDIGKKKEVFIQAENLLNTPYDVGVSAIGLRTRGAPLSAVAGVRSRF